MREVSFFEEHDRFPSHDGIAGDGGSVNASADHQKVFVQAADEARTWDHQTAGANEQKLLAELAKTGVQLYKPTPDEYVQWASIREKVWQEVADELKGKLDLGVAEQLRQG